MNRIGVSGANAANCRWRRFKKIKFSNSSQHATATGRVTKTKSAPSTPVKKEPGLNEDETLLKTPSKQLKAKTKKGRNQTPSDDEDEMDVDEWALVQNENEFEDNDPDDYDDDELAATADEADDEAIEA